MTTLTATRKQTAGNNAFLARVKRVYNHKMYASALKITNTLGERYAREFLQQYEARPLDEVLDLAIAILDRKD